MTDSTTNMIEFFPFIHHSSNISMSKIILDLCQEFAVLNRSNIAITILENIGYEKIMMSSIEQRNYGILLSFNRQKLDWFETIHNYISFKDNIVRKGAISAKKGERVLIPMNMRDGCIIAVGKGNDDWNQSAPHGQEESCQELKQRKHLI